MAGCSFHQGSPIAEWKRWENVKGVYNLCIYNIRIHKDRKKMGEETLRQSLTSWFPVFEGAPFNEAAVYFWSIAWRCFPDLYSKMQQVKLSLRGIIRHQPSEDFVKTWWKNVKCLVGIGSKAHTESCGGVWPQNHQMKLVLHLAGRRDGVCESIESSLSMHDKRW